MCYLVTWTDKNGQPNYEEFSNDPVKEEGDKTPSRTGEQKAKFAAENRAMAGTDADIAMWKLCGRPTAEQVVVWERNEK